ncbi:hypothetical protein [Streptomyces sp. fd1-xmd]|uniref:hypothetical protein n=1 Tax=Streptomyces sp. fd1-xmd TaxID=1812480 RepID=UPI00099071AF|nr:hypothetical protein [Streptomyces sp. fd1-xmd]AQT75205.1 hypothetical protein B1K54_29380 [Streptomyces sp. fd1-xmd]
MNMSGEADNRATRLNGVDGSPASPLASGGGSIFGSTPTEKNAAANTIETELEPNTKKATGGAKENTSAAAQSLDGWATASGLKKVAETWDQQAKALMGRLSAEKASLRSTSGLFVRNDIRTGDELRALGPKSKLEGL